MDIFQQNWKMKIQTDPFVNKTLNNYPTKDRVGNIRFKTKRTGMSKKDPTKIVVIGQHYNRGGASAGKFHYGFYERYQELLNNTTPADTNAGRLNWWPGKENAVLNHHYLDPRPRSVGGVFEVRIPYRTDVIKKEYHANARPNSLYNLRYASLRK